MKNNLLLILFSVILCACTVVSCKPHKLANKLDGSWIVDSVNFKGHDIKRCLTLNAISFDTRKGTCNLFGAEYFCQNLVEKDTKATFTLQEMNDTEGILNIQTGNQFFQGQHRILLAHDSIGYILTIKSTDLFMSCSKMF